MSTISNPLSPAIQALTSALPSLLNTPQSLLQNASPGDLAALAAASVQSQQVQELFAISGSADSVSLSDAALSFLSSAAASSHSASSANSLLQQIQSLFSPPAAASPQTDAVPGATGYG
jgi:hypothetical protein